MEDHKSDRRRETYATLDNAEYIIVIPSLSFPTNELTKFKGIHNYEERLFYYFSYLTNPNIKIVYATSLPLEKSTILYYIQLLTRNSSFTPKELKKRVLFLSCDDTSSSCLVEKLYRHPILIEKIKQFINPSKSLMVTYIGTNLEYELANELNVQLFANDYHYSYFATRAGNKEIFAEAEIPHPKSSGVIKSVEGLIEALSTLYIENNSEITKFVIKQNNGLGGIGTCLLHTKYFDRTNLHESIRDALENKIEFQFANENWESYQQKIQNFGVMVEIWIDDAFSSPSCQGIIYQNGDVEILSTHEQILHGLIYVGCEFPAKNEYRQEIMNQTAKIGNILSRKGCRERFGVDFVVKKENDSLNIYAIEINIRWTGTSHPFLTAKRLINSEITEDGLLKSKEGKFKYYFANDCVINEIYAGLTPRFFIEFINSNVELQFDSDRMIGIVIYNFSFTAEFGRFGVLAISDSIDEAKVLYFKSLQIIEAFANEIHNKKRNIALE
ncbi:unnamed protein product [Blepharisma stoltei]|uniref:ATP-grasp domain-containing protein n=1 Tax=Blepharisma stoltei TaxID=1481888 RepID=A0AAU9JZ00_9CILI|nr:unnamed protein product [Blepharisma stoltei]